MPMYNVCVQGFSFHSDTVDMFTKRNVMVCHLKRAHGHLLVMTSTALAKVSLQLRESVGFVLKIWVAHKVTSGILIRNMEPNEDSDYISDRKGCLVINLLKKSMEEFLKGDRNQ